MEKKEMSFIENFAAAGKELEKAIKESKDGAMIMIAIEGGDDESRVSASVKGKTFDIETLLAIVAIKNKDFKTILTNAIKYVEDLEQRNK